MQKQLESVQKLLNEFKDLINPKSVVVEETSKATQFQVNYFQEHLNLDLAKKLTALDVETHNCIKLLENSLK